MRKGIWFFVVFVLLVTIGMQFFNDKTVVDDTIQVIRETKEVSLNDFLKSYDQGLFTKIALEDETNLKGYQFLQTGAMTSLMSLNKKLVEISYNVYITKKPIGTSLKDLGINFTGATMIDVKFNEKGFMQNMLEQAGPLLLVLVLLFFAMKFLLPKGGGFPFSIKAGKLNSNKTITTRFADVAGMDEVKMELSEIVDYLKHPEKYHKVGARHPKGVLLYGEPGSGKTLLARAVAGESSVPFFSVSGSEFMEMLVGMGAAKVRELFGKAKAVGRAIIFIDEIDAIGKKRGVGYTGGHQEQEQTLNQILTEMDGFDNKTNIIVIAATNRPDILDPALLRAGRFDRKVMVSRPTFEERILIFDYYVKDKKVNPKVNIESLAKRTSGLVGADIENIVNEASLHVAKDSRLVLLGADFEYALEKVVMGPEKKVKSIKEQEKKIIAFHELGHAVTSYFLPNADPVEKISIVRRGQALGVTWMMPTEDNYLCSRAKFLDEVVSLLGGRASEEIFFGENEITTGAYSDFEKATEIITNMIVKYGMDKELGPVLYADKANDEYKMYKAYSEKTAELIDKKIKDYLNDCYEKSKALVKKNKNMIEQMSKVLLEKEYLTKEEFMAMMKDINKVDEFMKEIAESKILLAKEVLKSEKKNKKNA
ncbi:MAG: cell division protein FtsH [candidate division SR1 bacterium CG_4_9_14_3_um_filter_40_9]|nr:MAG: cell division protein FtsH [candidate division SR1 bacterium CG_4_9_14_3_um_filter_40_9]